MRVLAEYPVILTETKTYQLTTCTLRTELLATENKQNTEHSNSTVERDKV